MTPSPTTNLASGSAQALGIRMRIGSGATDKYLSVNLAGEAHAMPILKVKEIIRMMRITPLPHAPQYVRGVVNLRGKAIAVIDLRSKLGMAAGADSNRTSIVVVQTSRVAQECLVGLVVDQVNEVLNIAADAIEPPPDIGIASGHLRGVGKIDDRVVLVIDIDGILAEDQGLV
jgi:purine-binding chemotaxis protein CheW